MEDKKVLLEDIERRLHGAVRLPHQAGAIAYDLFLLTFEFGLSNDDPHVRELVSVFMEKLKDWRFEDLAAHQADYAIRIATSRGELEYEDMHKLFSLCDEVYALEHLGLTLDNQKKAEYENAVRKRFRQESKKAQLVAEDNVDEWSKKLWWYRENLELK